MEESVRQMTAGPTPNVNLSPHLVRTAGALIAFGLGAIVVLVALSIWVALWLVFVGIVLVVAGVTAAIYIFIKYPETLMESGDLYRLYVMREFKGFKEEVRQHEPSEEERTPPGQGGNLESVRLKQYEDNYGLFLGHYWKPSGEEDQRADIRIQLRDHPHPDGTSTPIAAGTVESVTYQLGPRFSNKQITETDDSTNFALDISAYGSMLCVAEVRFNDGKDPLVLSRYIDFPHDL